MASALFTESNLTCACIPAFSNPHTSRALAALPNMSSVDHAIDLDASSSVVAASSSARTTASSILDVLAVLPNLDAVEAEALLAANGYDLERAISAHFTGSNRGGAGRTKTSEYRYWQAAYCHGARSTADVQRNLDVVASLLSEGQPVDGLGGPRMSTALLDACHTQRGSIVEILLAHGADPNQRYVDTRSYIPTEVYDHHRQVSISVDHVWYGRRDGDAPLHVVARCSMNSVVQISYEDALACSLYLLAAGANPLARTADGQTAADLLLENLSPEQQEDLLKLEAGEPLAPPGPYKVAAAEEATVLHEVRTVLERIVGVVEMFKGGGADYDNDGDSFGEEGEEEDEEEDEEEGWPEDEDEEQGEEPEDGAAEVEASEATGQWACKRCTLLNDLTEPKCGACDTPRKSSAVLTPSLPSLWAPSLSFDDPFMFDLRPVRRSHSRLPRPVPEVDEPDPVRMLCHYEASGIIWRAKPRSTFVYDATTPRNSALLELAKLLRAASQGAASAGATLMTPPTSGLLATGPGQASGLSDKARGKRKVATIL